MLDRFSEGIEPWVEFDDAYKWISLNQARGIVRKEAVPVPSLGIESAEAPWIELSDLFTTSILSDVLVMSRR